MKLVVGLPAFNEEKNLGIILDEIKQFTDKIIVCNDGSTDNTSKVANNFGAIVIDHSKNLGYGEAIKSIFSTFLETNGDILITIDADGQHKTDDIKKLIQPILDKRADIVIGSRFLESKSDIPKYRKLGIDAITKMTNISTRQKITDSQSGFRAYTRKVVDEVNISEHGMGVSTEILIKADRKEFKIVEVPITILYHGDTSTHHPIKHGASVLLSTMKFVSIEHPMKFYGILGIVFLSIGLFFTVWTIQVFSESRTILTNITLIGIGTTVVGVILLVTAYTFVFFNKRN